MNRSLRWTYYVGVRHSRRIVEAESTANFRGNRVRTDMEAAAVSVFCRQTDAMRQATLTQTPYNDDDEEVSIACIMNGKSH